MKEKQNKKAKHFGNPGMSSRAVYRNQKARFLNLSIWKKSLFLLAFVAAGGFFAFMINKDIISGSAIGAGVGLLTVIFLIAPDALIIVPSLIFFFAISLPIVSSYLSYASYGAVAPSSTEVGWSLLALAAASLVSTWISVQYSRGRAWLTLALTLASTFTLGYMFLTFMPTLGLYNAYMAMAFVLLIRCGGWSWITGIVSIGFSKIKSQKLKLSTTEENKILSAWVSKTSDEKKIASILDNLNSSYTIFHDMKVNRKQEPLQHLVVGPSGVFILASVNAEGRITENKAEGVQIPGVDLNNVTSSLLTQRALVAKKLKTNTSNIQVCIIVLSENASYVEDNMRKTLAVFRDTDGAIPSEHVTIVSLDRIVEEIDNGFAILNPLTQNILVQRAKIALFPAGIPTPARFASSEKVQVASIDADGHVDRPAKPANNTWVHDGVNVSIQTNAGVLENLRIVGEPYEDNNGRLIAQVCVNEEWVDAKMSGRNPSTYAYPVSAMVQL